jgi:hypothetical protein
MKKEWQVEILTEFKKSAKKEIKSEKPPNPFLTEISQTASLVLRFESDLQVVPDFKMLTDANILISDSHKRRNL